MFEVCFDGFEDLPAEKGKDCIESPQFTCFGHDCDLALRIYPGGNKDSNDGKVAVYLVHKSSKHIQVQATFIVEKEEGSAAGYFALSKYTYKNNTSWGSHNFADRTALISALQIGSLTTKVLMKRINMPGIFVPENPHPKAILERFKEERATCLQTSTSVPSSKRQRWTFS